MGAIQPTCYIMIQSFEIISPDDSHNAFSGVTGDPLSPRFAPFPKDLAGRLRPSSTVAVGQAVSGSGGSPVEPFSATTGDSFAPLPQDLAARQQIQDGPMTQSWQLLQCSGVLITNRTGPQHIVRGLFCPVQVPAPL